LSDDYDETSRRSRTNSYESTHLLDEDLKVDTLLALNLVQASKNRKVAEQTDVLARSTCGNSGDAWPSFGVAGIVDLSNESRGCGMLDTPDLTPFIVDPIDYVRWEKARRPGWVLVAEVLPSLILFVGSFVPLAPMVLEIGNRTRQGDQYVKPCYVEARDGRPTEISGAGVHSGGASLDDEAPCPSWWSW
jgi:hypothetical protein